MRINEKVRNALGIVWRVVKFFGGIGITAGTIVGLVFFIQSFPLVGPALLLGSVTGFVGLFCLGASLGAAWPVVEWKMGSSASDKLLAYIKAGARIVACLLGVGVVVGAVWSIILLAAASSVVSLGLGPTILFGILAGTGGLFGLVGSIVAVWPALEWTANRIGTAIQDFRTAAEVRRTAQQITKNINTIRCSAPLDGAYLLRDNVPLKENLREILKRSYSSPEALIEAINSVLIDSRTHQPLVADTNEHVYIYSNGTEMTNQYFHWEWNGGVKDDVMTAFVEEYRKLYPIAGLMKQKIPIESSTEIEKPPKWERKISDTDSLKIFRESIDSKTEKPTEKEEYSETSSLLEKDKSPSRKL